MARVILSSLLVTVLSSAASAELIRWSDGAGSVAEQDGNSFRWIARPQGPNMAADWGFNYVGDTTWTDFDLDTGGDRIRAQPTWQLDEITPLTQVDRNNRNWSAVSGQEGPYAMWASLEWFADGTLRADSYRHWYSIDYSSGVTQMDTRFGTLTQVPEPSALELLLLAALVFAAVRGGLGQRGQLHRFR